eukprot:2573876-Alexandrium_andersonii.AAC.1
MHACMRKARTHSCPLAHARTLGSGSTCARTSAPPAKGARCLGGHERQLAKPTVQITVGRAPGWVPGGN